MISTTHDPKEHGRELAERIISQATRYGLASGDVTVIISSHMEREQRALEAEGLTPEEISDWIEAAHCACRSRVEEERRRLRGG